MPVLPTIALSVCALVGPEPDGCRLTVGYGYLLELEGDRVRVYEHRALGALPVAEGPLAGDMEYTLGDDSVTFLDSGVCLPNPYPAGSRAVSLSWVSHPVRLEATELAPEVPTLEQLRDPRFNLEWFLATFDEHYPFFEQRAPDWYDLRFAARERVEESTTDAELMAVFGDLIAPLEDAHVWVEGAGLSAESEIPDPDPRASETLGRFRRLVERSYAEDRFAVGCRRRLAWALVAGDLGYLRIDSFENLGTEDEEDLDALATALNTALEDLRHARGIVLDLRFNGGGYDEYALAALGWFVRGTPVAARKYVRTVHDDVAGPFVHQADLRVGPRLGGPFRQPVALLVSRYTASAAEVFGLGLLERKAPVAVVGERTAGAFSDVLETRLPNGWTLALGNELYTTPDGTCHEGRGLPLDREVPTLRAAQLEAGEDPALEAALEWLRAADRPALWGTEEIPGKR